MQIKWTFAAALLALTFAISGLAPPAMSQDPASRPAEKLELGKAIAFDRSKGNCLACHVMPDGELPGNLAPPLIQMKARFPDRTILRAQIWDPTVRNPESVMPPYGRHKILSEYEIDLLVDYLYSL